MSKEKTLRCSECKGTNLLWQVYVNEFNEIAEDSGGDTWCDDCHDNVSSEGMKEIANE